MAAAPIAAGAFSWATPPIKSYAAWLDDLWLEHADARGPALTAKQQLALWRRIVADSAESSALIGHAGAAEWAAGRVATALPLADRPCRRSAPRRTKSTTEHFSRGVASYREWLAVHGWIDQAGAEAALAHAHLGQLDRGHGGFRRNVPRARSAVRASCGARRRRSSTVWRPP